DLLAEVRGCPAPDADPACGGNFWQSVGRWPIRRRPRPLVYVGVLRSDLSPTAGLGSGKNPRLGYYLRRPLPCPPAPPRRFLAPIMNRVSDSHVVRGQFGAPMLFGTLLVSTTVVVVLLY